MPRIAYPIGSCRRSIQHLGKEQRSLHRLAQVMRGACPELGEEFVFVWLHGHG